MKKVNWWLIAAYIVVIGLVVLFARPASAQNVIRKGNVFEQVDSVKKSQDTQTDLIYRDKKGREYTIYLSSRGNAYINMISKNGKPYKKYLPEVTKQLGTKNEK